MPAKTVDIPFPLSTATGKTPQEAAGRLLNCYAEPLGEGARSKAVWRRSPGASKFCTTTQTGFRGGLLVASTLYAAFSGKVTSYTSAGVETVVGNLSGTKGVFWARNNKVPTPDIVAVDPDNGAFTVTSSSVVTFADSDLPAANCVCFQDGYFFFGIGDGRCFSSDLNDITVNSLNFAKAESKPDGINRVIGYNGQLFMFGPNTTEIWYNAGNAVGFPYSRTTVISRGLAGRYAVAGQEDGFGGALIWVADDSTVVRLNGYQPEKISPPDLDRLISAVSDKNTLEAEVYIIGGHAKWVLSSPTWSYEFDLNSQKWNERSSSLTGSGRWRFTQSLNAFSKWIAGDTISTADLIYVDDSVYKENSAQQLFRIESGPVQKFPNRTRISRADFDFVVGVGSAAGADPIETEPVVQISWSLDGGRNWGNPLFRKLGAQQRTQRITITRLGLSGPDGIMFRLDVSDPVYVALMGGTCTAELRDH